MSTDERLLDIREVASFLHVSVPTVYRLVNDGQLAKPIQVGRRSVRWTPADIERFINANRG